MRLPRKLRRRLRVYALVEWLATVLPGEKYIAIGDDERMHRRVFWGIRYADLRNKVFPRRLYVPWQPTAPDGPYMIWRWRNHDLLRRPWPEGPTRERREAARARWGE